MSHTCNNLSGPNPGYFPLGRLTGSLLAPEIPFPTGHSQVPRALGTASYSCCPLLWPLLLRPPVPVLQKPSPSCLVSPPDTGVEEGLWGASLPLSSFLAKTLVVSERNLLKMLNPEGQV